MSAIYGPSMLELTEDEQRSLQIVSLKCNVQQQKQTGSSFNWKKVGLSKAWFRNRRLNVADMTPRVGAAFKFLQENNEYYEYLMGATFITRFRARVF